MGVFDNFPYTNVHELNTDWLVKTVKAVKNRTDEIDRDMALIQKNVDITNENVAITNANIEIMNNIIYPIPDYDAYTDAIQNSNQGTFVGKSIDINAPIEITDRDNLYYKNIVGVTFNMNTDMFHYGTANQYFTCPTFKDCIFYGNGHYLFNDYCYLLAPKFINCKFFDCGIIKNGYFVQSAIFDNCEIENTENTIFIQTYRIYDSKFNMVRCEQQNKAILLEANTTVTDQISVNNISFEQCIFEGQTNNIILVKDAIISLNNIYTEANSKPLLKITGSNRSVNPLLHVYMTNVRADHLSGVNFLEIDNVYNNSKWATVYGNNITISRCTLMNNISLWDINISNYWISSGGKTIPTAELSKINTAQNSVATFTSTDVTVRQFPALVTFDSSDGGWHTNAYIVSLSYGNKPNAFCLNDPSQKLTCVLNADGSVTVTLHASSSSPLNRSAVCLTKLFNHLASNNYWDSAYTGYTI